VAALESEHGSGTESRRWPGTFADVRCGDLTETFEALVLRA
jgi:hypothetical protein